MLNLSDIEYISKKTKLSEEKVYILTEDPKDFNLIINELAKDNLEEGILTISFELFTKLHIYKITLDSKYNFNEKNYVSETISNIYPKLDKEKIENVDIQDSWETLYEPNEDLAKYYFTLLSLFDKSLDRRRRQFPSKNFLYKKALDGFYNSEHNEIANHLNNWIILVKRMKEEYWN
jgi:hypothetical protein